MQEAKYDIYRDCLGYKDFKNFGGVRFSYRGVWIVLINDKIDLKWLNLSFDSYKVRCKRIFLV